MFVTVRHLELSKHYKAKNLTTPYIYKLAKEELKNNNYIRVCDIELEGDIKNVLAEAYSLTVSYNKTPWVTNKKLIMLASLRTGCRNTSVGDIIQIDGNSYLIKHLGFQLLDR